MFNIPTQDLYFIFELGLRMWTFPSLAGENKISLHIWLVLNVIIPELHEYCELFPLRVVGLDKI